MQGTLSELKIRKNVAALLFLGACWVPVVPALAWSSVPREGDGKASVATPAAIAGVVRDAQGVAQMGALVQLLAGDARTVATAFTDQHGRYTIAGINPGKYMVRASATLFVPSVRSNLQLQTGATAVVNMTLAALFDTTAWLPAKRRRADESEDDWKWTLRSAANRPILRIVEDGESIEVSSSAAEGSNAMRAKARGAIESGDGSFGRGGVHTIETIHRRLDDGSDMMLRADMGTPVWSSGNQPGQRAAGSEYDAGFEGKTGFDGGVSRTVASYSMHPELLGGGIEPGGALQVLRVTSAQRMSLGERVEVEAGGRMEAVRTSVTGFATRPFLRVSANPGGAWTLEYRLATERELQQFGDVASSEGDAPVALVRNGRLALESGHHQEFSVDRQGGRMSLRAAIYQDKLGSTVIAGGESGFGRAGSAEGDMTADGGPSSAAGVPMPVGIVLDPVTGTFKGLAAGYRTTGGRLTASSALSPSLWISAEYSTGTAMVAEPGGFAAGPISYQDALNSLKAERSQTATLALKGKLVTTGTRVRASYRWQPAKGVTAVDPYSAFGDQEYLSCLIRQSIHVGRLVPRGFEATIDVTNLLAQGYRPFLSADGQTLYFAQSPRSIQAGVSFSF